MYVNSKQTNKQKTMFSGGIKYINNRKQKSEYFSTDKYKLRINEKKKEIKK